MKPLALRGVTAMRVVAVEIAAIYLLSTIPTPLYVLYQQGFKFSNITLTSVYAIYVVGTIATMFFLGRLADQIGRKPVVLVSLGLAAVSAIVFLFVTGTAWLFPARILSGLSIALASGASTAWITELHPENDVAGATQLTIGANLLGLGVGALLAGLAAQFAPWPLQLSYVVFLIVLAPIAFFVWRSQETVSETRNLARTSIRPRLGIPQEIRLPFLPPAIGAFAVFSVLGFYTALIPTLLSHVLQNKNHATAGAIVGELFAAGVVAVACSPNLKSRSGLIFSLALLVPSVGFLVAAELLRSMAILIVGTAISGVATGLGYRCSLQVVNEIAPEDQRSEVVSTYLIACYCGISVPIIGIGFVAKATKPAIADEIFAGLIAALSLTALAIQILWSPAKAKSKS